MTNFALRCPCGEEIPGEESFRLRSANSRITILCPNPKCHLEELGVAELKENDPRRVRKLRFNRAFSSWNVLFVGREEADRLLRKFEKKLVALIQKAPAE